VAINQAVDSRCRRGQVWSGMEFRATSDVVEKEPVRLLRSTSAASMLGEVEGCRRTQLSRVRSARRLLYGARQVTLHVTIKHCRTAESGIRHVLAEKAEGTIGSLHRGGDNADISFSSAGRATETMYVQSSRLHLHLMSNAKLLSPTVQACTDSSNK
jgi:hypothetical protein